MNLAPLPSLEIIKERLALVFPESMAYSPVINRELGVRTVFTMLYIGAVGLDIWLSPKHVYSMSDTQASEVKDEARRAYGHDCLSKNFKAHHDRWYADNSRESIRDETLRNGLIPTGAVVVRAGIPTTSSKPRYSLEPSFADLFQPTLRGSPLVKAISDWQAKHLTTAALARIKLSQSITESSKDKVLVKLPNGESRSMTAGASSLITKAVVEIFAARFLRKPALIWISESGNKVVQRDDALAKSLGLKINASLALPDIILADVDEQFLLVFVEVVHSDGPISAERRKALLDIALEAGLNEAQVAFVTAFRDRSDQVFTKTVKALAWGSFAWFATEPNSIIALDGLVPQGAKALSEL